MELRDRAMFNVLKKKFAMECAICKQDNPTVFSGMDDDELFRTLLLMETNSSIVDAVNAHLEYDSSSQALRSLCSMIVLEAHELLDSLASNYSEEEIERIRSIITNITPLKNRLNKQGEQDV
jgi:hypothetical protein